MSKKIYISNIQFNSLNESLKSQLSVERKAVDKNPSQKQIEAGNYSKGHITIMGLDITIENPKGSYRKGVDKNGNEWKTLMNNDYGYFRRTLGKDGDAIDVFIGPNLSSEKIFPIDQYLGGNFDETKVMLGFNTAAEAKKAYLSNYEKGWKGFKYVSEVNLEDFKKWLYDGYRQRKPFAKYKTLFESQDVMNESKQGLQSKKLFDIIKKYGNRNQYNTSWFDLQSVKDEDVVGVFTFNELPKKHAELKKWVISKGYQLDPSDDVAIYELDKTENGYITTVVIIVPNANYDGTSFSKEGGFKNYIQKKNAREAARNNDGAKTYNWKGGNELSDLSLKNPYYQKWDTEAKKSLDSRIKDVYGKTYGRVKGLNESYVDEAFEEYTQEDLLCEHISLSEGIDKDMLNKYKDSRRKEDIANHGKPTAFYGKVEKSKKAYSRKGKNKFNPEDELDESCGKRKVHLTEAQFKQFCRTLLENRRNEEYVEKIVKDIIS